MTLGRDLCCRAKVRRRRERRSYFSSMSQSVLAPTDLPLMLSLGDQEFAHICGSPNGGDLGTLQLTTRSV